MCGIAGIVSDRYEDLSDRLARMTDTLAHRGPDDAGTTTMDGVALGHRRLKVIDLSANGHQPMANEDGSVWITYNGEVYETTALRVQLEAAGHRFRSRTDTEVVVHLYEEKGTGLFRYLNGMFAFAIHDRTKHRLLLGRDRLGIKPLYYARLEGMLLFASEIKALIAGLGRRPSLRSEALGQYLLQGYVSTPDTAFEGLQVLPPATFLDINLREVEGRQLPAPVEYWDAPFTGDDSRPAEEIAADIVTLLGSAVEGCTIADVPLGAFLSGGIDSSSVVTMMARRPGPPVRTFTVALPGVSRNEAGKARAVAEKCQTLHTEIDSTAADADDYWRCVDHFDTPFNCASLLSARYISEAARRHVTVALSGDGGDELFGGYTRYLSVAENPPRTRRRPLLLTAASALPDDLRGRARLVHLAENDFSRYFTAEHPLAVGTAERLAGACLGGWVDRMRAIYERYPADRLTRAMYLDLKTYLPDHILTKVDNASMAVSLEVRVPMLDHRLVELAGRIPSRLKLCDGTGKWILKRAMTPMLPQGLIDQEKVGFDPPLASWLFDAQIDIRLSELSSRQALFRDVLDSQIVDRWIRALREGSRWQVPRRAGLWGIYQLERWLQLQQLNDPFSVGDAAALRAQ